jgi:23S rRNA maturation mini-RNase III
MLSKDGDTTICFSIEKARFLAREHYKADYYFKSDSLCKLTLTQKNLQIKMFEKIDQKSQSVINNQNSIIRLKDEELEQSKIALKNANRTIKRQKTYKVLSLSIGAAISTYLGFLYVTK